MTATAMKQPQTPGAMIDALFELRERYKAVNAEAKALKDDMDEMERLIMANLDSLDLALGRGRLASASVTESEVPTVTDWEAVYGYIRDNEAEYLLERRMSATAWRELYNGGELIPGTEPFKKRGLSLRKL